MVYDTTYMSGIPLEGDTYIPLEGDTLTSP